MMAAIWAFIRSPLGGPILGGALIAVLIAAAVEWGVGTWKISDLEHQLEVAQAQINDPATGYAARLASCQVNVRTLREAFDDLNGQIERLGAELTRQDALARQLMIQAAEEARGARNRADAILALSSPPPAEQCKAARELLKVSP